MRRRQRSHHLSALAAASATHAIPTTPHLSRTAHDARTRLPSPTNEPARYAAIPRHLRDQTPTFLKQRQHAQVSAAHVARRTARTFAAQSRHQCRSRHNQQQPHEPADEPRYSHPGLLPAVCAGRPLFPLQLTRRVDRDTEPARASDGVEHPLVLPAGSNIVEKLSDSDDGVTLTLPDGEKLVVPISETPTKSGQTPTVTATAISMNRQSETSLFSLVNRLTIDCSTGSSPFALRDITPLG